jgi:hypothetical protein
MNPIVVFSDNSRTVIHLHVMAQRSMVFTAVGFPVILRAMRLRAVQIYPHAFLRSVVHL